MLYKTGAPKVRGLFEDRKLLVASFYQVPEQACFVPTDTSSVTNCLSVFIQLFTEIKVGRERACLSADRRSARRNGFGL